MAMIPNKNEMPSQSPTERGKNIRLYCRIGSK